MDVKVGLSHYGKNRLRVSESMLLSGIVLRERKWREAGQYCVMKSFMIITGIKSKEHKMARSCSTYVGDENCIHSFLRKT